MTTPQIIKARRLELGWSQLELARRVSVAAGYTREVDFYGQSAVARWESDGPLGRPLTAEVLAAMATVLELDPLELLGGYKNSALHGAWAPVAALSSYADVLLAWANRSGCSITLLTTDAEVAATLEPA